LRANHALLTRATIVTLGAHESVPAGVSRGTGSAASTISAVETWKAPRTLESVLAVGACLASRTLRPFSAARALRTSVALVSFGTTSADNTGGTLGTSITFVSLGTRSPISAVMAVTAVAPVTSGQTRVAVCTVAAVLAVHAVETALAWRAHRPADAVLAVLTGKSLGTSVANGSATPGKTILSVSAIFAGRTGSTVNTCAAISTGFAISTWFPWQYCGDSVATILAGLATGSRSANVAVEAGAAFGTRTAAWTRLARGTDGATPAAETLRTHLAVGSRSSWSTARSILAGETVLARATVGAGTAGDADAGGATRATRARSGLESTHGGDLGKDVLLHQVDFGSDRLLVEGLALQKRGLGHLELLLGNCLLIAERQNGCSISGFSGHCPV